MHYLWVLVPSVITLIICILFSKGFSKGEKIDKGIGLCYWNLSYRRKFIRTLWLFPIFIIIMVFFHITFRSNFHTFIVGAVLCVLFFGQAIYNYMKWKKEEYSEND